MKAIFIALSLLVTVSVSAQLSKKYDDVNDPYKMGLYYFNEELYGQSLVEFKKVLEQELPVGYTVSNTMKLEAELKYAQCALRLGLTEGEKLIEQFLAEHASEPIAQQAHLDVGNFYFANKEYDKAIQFYSKSSKKGLSKTEQNELNFKLGYSYFLRKKFAKAKNSFGKVKDDTESVHYYPSNYYFGMCAFYQKNNDTALEYFKKANGSKKYGRETPYYIAQIYFAKKQYKETIDWSKQQLKKDVKYKTELKGLVGQAYFEQGDYKNALVYLEDYVANSRKLTEKQLYQIAFTQYKTGNYANAIKNFEELNQVEGKIGQYAMYSLADCYLKVNELAKARNAFKKAYSINHDASISSASHFNYSKLSFDLGYYNEALKELQTINSNSPYYSEAQGLISKVFLKTKDYANAVKTIESMPNKSMEIRRVYQKVALYRGLQLYNDNNLAGATAMFTKSLMENHDSDLTAYANYWMGEMKYKQEDYSGAVSYMNRYLKKAPSTVQEDINSSTLGANYTIGYANMRTQGYKTAVKHFNTITSTIEKNRTYLNNAYYGKKMYPDALMRAGDCYLTANSYKSALKNYDKVIKGKYNGFDYAMYQKAIIKGLVEGESVNKILLLEDIADNYPTSKYADDALYQLGRTYFNINKLQQAKKTQLRLVNNYKSQSALYYPALLQLGLISANQDQPDEALKYYKKVFENNIGTKLAVEALPLIEEIYVSQGNPDGYFKYLESVKGYKVSDAKKEALTFKVAEQKYIDGDYAAAIDALSNYIRKFPSGNNVTFARFLRGDAAHRLKRYKAALTDYEYIINRGPSEYYNEAIEYAADICYNDQGDFVKAFQYYKQWEAVAPTSSQRTEALLGQARSAYRSTNTSAVFAAVEKINGPSSSASDGEKGEGNYYAGKVAYDSKNYNDAIRYLGQSIAYVGNNERAAESKYLIAQSYFNKKQIGKAEEQCLTNNQSIADYPYWLAQNIILLGDIFAEKKDYFNAKAAYESVIENYQEDAEITKEATDKLNKVKAAEKAGSKLDFNQLTPDEGADLEVED